MWRTICYKVRVMLAPPTFDQSWLPVGKKGVIPIEAHLTVDTMLVSTDWPATH